MTDKVQKIREEVERLREQLQNKVEESDFISGEVFIINYFLTFIDSLQEDPVGEDLKLSWEDIPKIFQISEELKTSWWFRDNEQTKQIGKQPFWEEVLKRFREMKEREEQMVSKDNSKC